MLRLSDKVDRRRRHGGKLTDMADDDLDPQVLEDLNRQAEEQDSQLPETVEVPTGVSEDEAMEAVKKQMAEAGFECPDDKAREIVRAAQAKSDAKDDKSDESDAKDAKDDKSDE
jgi:hypothetical protein